MRKIAFGVMSMLLAAVLVTSCDKDDSDGKETLPAEMTYTESNGLKLSYNGSPMPARA